MTARHVKPNRLRAALALTRAAASMAAAICISAATSRRARPVGLALLATAVLMVGAIAFASGGGYAPAASTTDTLAFLRSQRDACQVMLDSATTSAQRTRARTCISDVERAIAALLASPTPSPMPSPTATPTATPTASPTGSPSPAPSPTASPTPAPTTPAPSPTQSPTPAPTTPSPTPSPTAGGWPGPGNTGVPAGTTLTPYTGPCTLAIPGTVLDAKLVNCDLTVTAANVTITRTQVNGTVWVDWSENQTAARLAISDSNVDAGHRLATGLGDGLYVATRVEITGGNRGALCAWRCTIQDSWVHGTYVESDWHASGVRAERYSTIVHNRLSCDWYPPTAQDGGCSADLTGYPDFTAIHDWLIKDNLFTANAGNAYCAYGGSSAGKPYSSDPLTGVNIQFIGNVFERGTIAGDKGLFRCGYYGAVDSFDAAKPGAVWSGNRYDDGVLVTP